MSATKPDLSAAAVEDFASWLGTSQMERTAAVILRALLAERDALAQELAKVMSALPCGSPEWMRAMAASTPERFARKLYGFRLPAHPASKEPTP
jgi:hypothetical protein